ncbi:hypothetical protein H8356DRAFT_1330663 [Neocallimastix lanati (nom. inval.)]|nr:hypothetical protein H8356DRAFT_1330663 [Neocallimastix sp. JGI-2020a]
MILITSNEENVINNNNNRINIVINSVISINTPISGMTLCYVLRQHHTIYFKDVTSIGFISFLFVRKGKIPA